MAERINFIVAIGLVASLMLCLILMAGLYAVAKAIPSEMYMLISGIIGILGGFLGQSLRVPHGDAKPPMVTNSNVEQINVEGEKPNEDIPTDGSREGSRIGTTGQSGT